MIRDVNIEDSKDIVNIYNYYIEETTITFEKKKLEPKDMEERIVDKTKENPWIVYEEDDKVLGYAYVGTWKTRAAFEFSKEISIYVDKDAKGRKIGTKLMEAILNKCKEYKIHTLISIIAVPNERSIKLHEKFGFKKAGYFKEVGYKFDKWIDLVYLQLENL